MRPAPSWRSGCRSAAASGSTTPRAAPASARCRTACAARAVTTASEIALIGTQTMRPVQPRSRSRRRNAPRVVTSGSKRFTIGGASSKCVAHHAIASAHRPTSQTAIGRRGPPEPEVPASEQMPAHQPRQRRIRRRRRARPGRMMRTAMPSARRLPLDERFLQRLAPDVGAESDRSPAGRGVRSSCRSHGVRGGRSTDRLLTSTSRETPASCIARSRWRVASIVFRWCAAKSPAVSAAACTTTSAPASASGETPRLRSATTHSSHVRIVGVRGAADAADAIERARDLAAEESAGAGHDDQRRRIAPRDGLERPRVRRPRCRRRGGADTCGQLFEHAW